MNKVNNFAAIAGKWIFEENSAIYESQDIQIPSPPYGLALFEDVIKSGIIKANIEFIKIKDKDVAGRVVIGYDPKTKDYYSIGIGGYQYAYVIDKYKEGIGWSALEVAGWNQEIVKGKEYEIEIQIFGQKVILKVNRITIFEIQLPEPLKSSQTGLFAWGNCEIKFSDISIISEKPKAFVVMQFTEPYDSIYREVIKPVCEEMNLSVYRADEVYRPGTILKDIIEGIVESEIIIADITPPNPNVFYELGFSHALNKVTILLARHGSELPFDIRSYRVIFYDDTIKGKTEVEDNLRRHLKNILR